MYLDCGKTVTKYWVTKAQTSLCKNTDLAELSLPPNTKLGCRLKIPNKI